MNSNVNVNTRNTSNLSFKNLVSKVFGSPKNEDRNKNEELPYRIRQRAFFVDSDIQKSFVENGYVVLKDVIRNEEISDFRNGLNLLTSDYGLEFTTEFINVGCIPNIDWRDRTRETIWKHSKEIFSRFFDVDQLDLKVSGSYVIKPAHEDSELEIHQDASFIDEDKDYSLYIWIPFVDINEDNGPLWVLPGSHLWGNTQRGFGVPWQFDKHKKLLKKFMKPVYVQARDAIIFDSSLVHGSSANVSNDRRDAMIIAAVRKDPDLVYYHQVETNEGKVLKKFKVNSDFFDAHDYQSEPDGEVWKYEVDQLKNFDLSKRRMTNLIEKYLPQDTGN